MEIINIVYSADSNYLIPTLISMKSVLVNRRAQTKINFFILTKNKLLNNEKKMFKAIEDVDCQISFLNVGNLFDGFNENDQFTQACYYRLVIPIALNNIRKCIYLDGDTIVTDDISKLFIEDVSNYYLAACKDCTISWDLENDLLHAKRIGLCSLDSYINSGVLLLNLEKMRDDNVFAKFKSEIHNTYKYLFFDQDILNVVLNGNIKILHPKYNCFPYYYSKRKKHREKVLTRYSRSQIEDAIKHPVVIHYASAEKPWNSKCLRNRKKWLEIVNTFDKSFREEIIFPYITEKTVAYDTKNGKMFSRVMKKMIKMVLKRIKISD